MIIIADSGSSNTNWIILNAKHIESSFTTIGLSPYFVDSKIIHQELSKNFPKNIDPNEISKVHFYGSGCSSEKLNLVIEEGLNLIFPKSDIEINTDLIAAARALFFNDKGIAVICGTGSNTCYYDGKNIKKNITSLGYIFGDEGSGSYLGKLFISDFLNDELPQEIRNMFVLEYNFSKDDILFNVYKKSNPNKFLASFTNFILKNSDNKYFDQLISKNFNDLFDKYICRYENYKNLNIRFVGSVAFHFNKQLKNVAKKFNTKANLIIQKPIERLAQYHIDKLS